MKVAIALAFYFFFSFISVSSFQEVSWKDSFVQRDEVIEAIFSSLDKNNDHIITLDECFRSVDFIQFLFYIQLRPYCTDFFQRCDANQDDKITLQDFQETKSRCISNPQAAQFYMEVSRFL
jgi:hypothetical protein